MRDDKRINIPEVVVNDDIMDEVRVFVSSTFKDFELEREYLMKKIFPVLSQICKENKVQFSEVDLRWGITEEEAKKKQIIKVCLEEIDNCRPYFIGIVGNRYGWVPSKDDFDPNEFSSNTKNCKLVTSMIDEGKSITEIEMMYGALDAEKEFVNAYFYLYKGESSVAGYEKSESKEKQSALREKIKSSRHIWREFTSKEELGKLILNDFKDEIDSKYQSNKSLTLKEKLEKSKSLYEKNMMQVYIQNNRLLNSSIDIIKRTTCPIVITGEVGSGKSSIMIALKKKIQDENALLKVTDINRYFITLKDKKDLMSELIRKINNITDIDINITGSIDNVNLAFEKCLSSCSNKEIVIFIDGLDGMEEDIINLNWLPTFIPKNIKFVFALSQEALSQIVREYHQIKIEIFSDDDVVRFSKKYLEKFGKKLSSNTLDIISNNSNCQNPLFLKVFLNELRRIGKYEKLDSQAKKLLSANSLEELFLSSLYSLEYDFGNDKLKIFLLLLILSENGLTEEEIKHILEPLEVSRLDLFALYNIFKLQLNKVDGKLVPIHSYFIDSVKHRYLTDFSCESYIRGLIIEYFCSVELSFRALCEMAYQLFNSKQFGKLYNLLIEIENFKILYTQDKNILLFYNIKLKKEGYDLAKKLTSNSVVFLQNTEINLDILNQVKLVSDFLYYSGSLNEAKKCYDTIHEKLEGQIEVTAIWISDFYEDYAMLLSELGVYNEVLNFAIKSNQIIETSCGKTSERYLANLDSLACIYGEVGDYKNALNAHEYVVNQVESSEKYSFEFRCRSLFNYSEILRNLGFVKKGKLYGEEALHLAERIYGTSHPYVAICMTNLGMLNRMSKEYEIARPLINKAKNIRESRFGISHPSVANSFRSLGLLELDEGKIDDAVKSLEKALEIRVEKLGENHPYTSNMKNYLARAYMRNNNSSKAYGILIQAFNKSLMNIENGSTDTYSASIAYSLYILHLQRNEKSKSVYYLDYALEILKSTIGEIYELDYEYVNHLRYFFSE